jgi:hypothetical protein
MRFRNRGLDCSSSRSGAYMVLPDEEVVAVGVAIEIGVGTGPEGRFPRGEVLEIDAAVAVEIARDAINNDSVQRGDIASHKRQAQ